MRANEFIPAKPWAQTRAFYQHLLADPNWCHVTGLLALVEYVESGRLRHVLFGATSHDVLIVSPYERFDLATEVLQVRAVRSDATLEFSYSGARGVQPWIKRIESTLAAEALERFVRELKWVVGEPRGTDA